MEPKKPRKTIEEQEQAIQERLRRLEQKKKRLATIKDKRRTRRLILVGALFEHILSEPGKNKTYYASRAKEMYAKRPADLAIVLEFFESYQRATHCCFSKTPASAGLLFSSSCRRRR